jgi:spore maturation protein SpmA
VECLLRRLLSAREAIVDKASASQKNARLFHLNTSSCDLLKKNVFSLQITVIEKANNNTVCIILLSGCV